LAIRRQRQIQIEDLILAELPFDFQRTNRLPQLGINRALAARFHQPRQLHRDRGAAGHDMAARDELERGAAQRPRIDAGMGAEAPVFVG
jgi:hypothetical protein